jgi:hypothetical protein
MSTVDIDGSTTRYEISGSGPPILGSFAFISALPEPSPLAAEGWSLTRVGFFQTRHRP